MFYEFLNNLQKTLKLFLVNEHSNQYIALSNTSLRLFKTLKIKQLLQALQWLEYVNVIIVGTVSIKADQTNRNGGP